MALRKRMQAIANKARSLPDPKVKYLLEWIRRNLCPGLGASRSLFGPLPKWNDRRVLIFTENRQSTKKYLREMIEGAIAGTDRAEERLKVIDGQMNTQEREEIQQRFNAHPSKDPLRILLATAAAREGLNFQAHCADLFHYDLPWNPGRIEQRNGRIDRKLQPEPRVRCHYFVLPQRAEDHVLEVLVRKTKTIKSELGSLATVIDESIEHKLRKRGIRHADVRTLARELEAEGSWGSATELKAAAQDELESVRKRESELHSELDRCRRVLDRSGRHVNFNSEHLRDALSCSLELLGADPLKESHSGPEGARVWIMPPLDRRGTTDPSWTRTLDTLRKPKKRDEKLSQWRSDAPIRPVVFEDRGVLSDETVHLHLEQRMVQRLLARFRTQGFVHHDLSRACLAQARDPIPRVILLGRLLLYGSRAERLHEEVIPVTARWIDPSRRSGTLKAFALQAERRTLRLLEESLELSRAREPSETVRNTLLASAGRDINELLEQLEPRAREAANEAERALQERGEIEQSKSKDTLREQRKRVVASLEKEKERSERQQLSLLFKQAEIRQLRANMRSWERRIKQFDRDIETVPERVRSLYEVHARRVEPVGLVYLWPESN